MQQDHLPTTELTMSVYTFITVYQIEYKPLAQQTRRIETILL